MRKKLLRALCALLIAVTAALAAVPAQADARGDLYMYVETGNKGKLHLRAKPDSGSESLGLYRNGTKVLIEGFANGTWAAVLVDGRRGYMNIHYLSGYAPAVTGPAVLPAVTENTTLYVRTGNSGKLHLRANASQDADSLGLYPNGTPVHVTSRNGAWAFVNVNGAMGFMMLNYLSDSPSAASSFVQQPTPAPLSGAVTRMYVNTGNTGRLHLRAAAREDAASLGLYANGTMVYASPLGNGWSQVTVGGQTGYMMTQYLSPVPGLAYPYYTAQPTAAPYVYQYPYAAAPTPAPVYSYYVPLPTAAPTASPAPSLYAGAAVTVRNRNSSFVYLRSSRDSDRKDNILAQVPVGEKVTVLEPGQYWSRVRYDGIEGYMVSGYLK